MPMTYDPVGKLDADDFDLCYPHRGIPGGQKPRGNVRKMTRRDLIMLRLKYLEPNPLDVSEKEVEKLLQSTSRNLTLLKAVVIKNERRRDGEARVLLDLTNWSQEMQERLDALSNAPTLNLRMR